MQVIIQDHYVPMVVYNAGAHTLTREKVGTRYALVAIRTLVDPNDAKDVRKVRALQDAIKVQQTAPGTFEVPSWDQASQKKVREALLALRREGSGRSGAPPDRLRAGMVRQPGQGCGLPERDPGEERHRAVVSPACRDSQRHVQVSRGAARDLRGSLAVMRSGHEKMMAPCA